MPSMQVDRDLIANVVASIERNVFLSDWRMSQRAPIEDLIAALAAFDAAPAALDETRPGQCPSCGCATDRCTECGEQLSAEAVTQLTIEEVTVPAPTWAEIRCDLGLPVETEAEPEPPVIELPELANLRVACPFCEAPEFELCRVTRPGVSGLLPYSHRPRVRAALERTIWWNTAPVNDDYARYDESCTTCGARPGEMCLELDSNDVANVACNSRRVCPPF